MTGVVSLGKLALGLSLALLLSACADELPEECEPGVSEIGRTGTVTPPGC